MNAFQRAFGFFGLVAGLFGLAAFLALAAACGYYFKTVRDRAEKLLAKADLALGELEKAVNFIDDTCDAARKSLDEARAKSAAAPAAAPSMTGMILKNTLLDTPDKVRSVNQAVVTASEGLLLAQAAFDSMHDLPMSTSGDESQSLERMRSKIQGASTALNAADGILRSTSPSALAHISREDASIVENAINQTKALTAEVSPQMKSAQARVKEARNGFADRFFWLTTGLIAFFLLGAWGQAALIRLSLRRLRRDAN